MQQETELYIVIIIGIILGLLLVGFIVTTLFLYQRRQRRQEKELERLKNHYELEELRSQLEVQENTLKNISQELHDNIGQMLSVAKLTFSSVPLTRGDPGYERFQNALQILTKAGFDLSHLTKSLHTDRIVQLGLVESIRAELDNIRKTGIIEPVFNLEGEEAEFPKQKALYIFRIFQETLNNILKHSQATHATICLSYSPDRFTLEIEDNGRGFNLNEKQKSALSGVGLKSMYDRAKLIGAEISINSQPDEGTKLVLKMQLEKELEHGEIK